MLFSQYFTPMMPKVEAVNLLIFSLAQEKNASTAVVIRLMAAPQTIKGINGKLLD